MSLTLGVVSIGESLKPTWRDPVVRALAVGAVGLHDFINVKP
jgi:hypothetical protein